MLRDPSSTPCPIFSHIATPNAIRFDEHGDANDDNTTANIDFTTEFRASFRNVKPRRRGSVVPRDENDVQKTKRKTVNGLGFAIHEDNNEENCGLEGRTDGDGCEKRQISRPRQRLGPGFARSQTQQNTLIERGPPGDGQGVETHAAMRHSTLLQSHDQAKTTISGKLNRLSQAPRRPIFKHMPSPIQENVIRTSPTKVQEPVRSQSTTIMLNRHDLPSPKRTKPIRRGPIYIPPDDTTMPSMYMDMFSPIRNLHSSSSHKSTAEHQPEMNLTGIAAQMYNKKTRQASARKSYMASSPKRVPLQMVQKQEQTFETRIDVVGQGGGKENLPPGYEQVSAKGEGRLNDAAKKIIARRVSSCVLVETQETTQAESRLMATGVVEHEVRKSAKSSLFAPTASSLARHRSAHESQLRRTTRPRWKTAVLPRVKEAVLEQEFAAHASLIEAQGETIPVKPAIPIRIVAPSIKTEPAIQHFPLLDEGITNASLYEENWLSHQEIVITQLLNDLFDASDPRYDKAFDDISGQRKRFLELYNDPAMETTQKRLQAALLYGSLSIPKEALADGGRLFADLGRRRAFTDFWLQTYNLDSLRCALEVVTGRQCTTSQPKQLSTSSTSGPDALCSTVQSFIEIFLIRNEDSRPDSEEITCPLAWSYQRTLRRSLMLIKLLDLSRSPSSGSAVLPPTRNCLFNQTSAYNSSSTVVQVLFRLLNPAAGDPLRALMHLGYTVTHCQYPLEEFDYRISNLAVDLRDGVRLTRLVELLLYPSASQEIERLADTTQIRNITSNLPTNGPSLKSAFHRDWPLSQHLKFSCVGRATKLSNIQIALDALKGVQGFRNVLESTTAEDIANGFREKTVKLLWSLTCKWGLGGLVDWKDLQGEIKRLRRQITNSSTSQRDEFDFDLQDSSDATGNNFQTQRALLKSWARSAAEASGFQMPGNFWNSFDNGKAFDAIVRTYEGYLCDVPVSTTTSHTTSTTTITSTSASTSVNTTTSTKPLSSKQSQSLPHRLKRLGCSYEFSSLFQSSSNPYHKNIFDRDFILAALTFLCSRLLAPSRHVRAAVCIQRAWRTYWNGVVEKRKLRVKELAWGCAKIARKENGFGGHGFDTAGATRSRDGGIHGITPENRDEEDIWLNLSPQKIK